MGFVYECPVCLSRYDGFGEADEHIQTHSGTDALYKPRRVSESG